MPKCPHDAIPPIDQLQEDFSPTPVVCSLIHGPDAPLSGGDSPRCLLSGVQTRICEPVIALGAHICKPNAFATHASTHLIPPVAGHRLPSVVLLREHTVSDYLRMIGRNPAPPSSTE